MTMHYLGLKSTDTPELAGAEFTEDVYIKMGRVIA